VLQNPCLRGASPSLAFESLALPVNLAGEQ